MLRHITASHLLEAGVDINTIRAWLGHMSVDATNVYAEVNARKKSRCPTGLQSRNKWSGN